MKKKSALFLSIVTALSLCVPSFCSEGIIKDGRTVVPLRGVFEDLGFSVDWDADTDTATVKDEEHTVTVAKGKTFFVSDGKEITPDVPQQIIDDRFYLPLRAVSESVGATVNWDNESKSAKIEYKGKTALVNCADKVDSPEISNDKVYDDILRRCKNVILNPESDEDESFVGVRELSVYDSAQALQTIGYAYKDINNDGKNELLIVSVNEQKKGCGILALYTIKDGSPVCCFESTVRSRFEYAGGNKFLYSGSGGAIYAVLGGYTLESQKTEITCKDFYFTSDKDGDYEDIRVYHNTVGETDPAISEEVGRGFEDFEKIMKSFPYYTEDIEATPFSEFGEEKNDITVKAQWLDKKELHSDYKEYYTPDFEQGELISFTPNRKLNSFKILSLTWDTNTERFVCQPIADLDEVDPEHPVAAGFAFIGDIPNYGISFTDENGKEYSYAVGVSGYDGKVELSEINP